MKETYAFISRFMVFIYSSLAGFSIWKTIQMSLTQQVKWSSAALWNMALPGAVVLYRENINMNIFLLTAQTAQSYNELHDTEPKKRRVKQVPQGHLIQQFAQRTSLGSTNICWTALPKLGYSAPSHGLPLHLHTPPLM